TAMKSLTEVLGDVLAIRGVLAVAVVSSDGDVLAVNAADTALLERMIGTVTGALAAGVALATLVETGAAPGDGEVSAGHGAAEIGDGTGSAWPAFDAPGAATASADPVSEAQHVPSAELSDGDAAGA